MGRKKKEQTRQQILAHTEEMQAEMNLRLLLDHPAFLENILWVENITVTAITWQVPKSNTQTR